MSSMASSTFVTLLLLMAYLNDAYLIYFCLLEKGTFLDDSTYAINLRRALDSFLSDDQVGKFFYNTSAGEAPDEVQAVGLCRGDIASETCRNCLDESKQYLRRACPNSKESIVWFEYCMFRYANRAIVGRLEVQPRYLVWNQEKIPNAGDWSMSLMTLTDRLKAEAVLGSSIRKYAAGKIQVPNSKTIYAVLQCTPDLTELECNDCLNSILSVECCSYALLVVSPSCLLKFDIFQFFDMAADGAAPPSLSLPETNNDHDSSKSTQGRERSQSQNIMIIIPSVLGGSLVFIIFLCLCMRFRKPMEACESSEIQSLQFEFTAIRDATDNFSEENKLGQGGFGSVYKGELPSGQGIAVKRLAESSGQGEMEFKNEVALLAKLQHRNLVRLLGFCLVREERLLIYELMANGSLNRFIFDPARGEGLDWEARYKIIKGIARGLLYLHEDSQIKIVHRDLKADNVLLDADMNPRISDFGTARLFDFDQTQDKTRRIVGTYGYMAPEYAVHGHFSAKSDVFSFGVLILEIISGQKNSSFHDSDNIEHLLTFGWKKLQEGKLENMIDPRLATNGGIGDIIRVIHIGFLCVQESKDHRPTMASVAMMLSNSSLNLPVPTQPGFLLVSGYEPNHSRDVEDGEYEMEIDVQVSVNQLSITDMLPR